MGDFMGRPEPWVYRRWDGRRKERIGQESFENALSGQYRYVEHMLCLYPPGIYCPSCHRYVCLAMPDSSSGSCGANYIAESGRAGTSGTRVRFCAKRGAGSLANHGIPDRACGTVDFYSLYDYGSRCGPAWLMVWYRDRSRSRTIVHGRRVDRSGGYPVRDALECLSIPVRTI